MDSKRYTESYSEESFFDKVRSTIKSAGLKLIYQALLLFYVTENPNCPMKIKAAIFAALGYFISHRLSCMIEFRSLKSNRCIERQKELGWEFVFMDANIDAVEVAGHIGIDARRAVNYHSDKKGTHEA